MCSQVIINRLVLILAILFFTGLYGFAQNTSESLRSILIKLEERLGVSFTYADETVENISINPPAEILSLEEVLTYLRTNTSLNYHQLDSRFINIIGKYYENINIFWYLNCADDQGKIAGATIQVDERMVISNNDGYFSMTAVPANSIVYLRILGYEAQSILATTITDNTTCSTLLLVPDVTRLREVMINNYLTSGINKRLNGSFILDIDNLGILPD